MEKRKINIAFYQYHKYKEKSYVTNYFYYFGILFIVGLTAFGLWFSNSDTENPDEHGNDMINNSTEK